jgi:SAM-dependent methyltransferase
MKQHLPGTPDSLQPGGSPLTRLVFGTTWSVSLILCIWAAVPEESAAGPASMKATELDSALVERWDARYRQNNPPAWDTGRPAGELQRLVEAKVLQPGRVLELGCGTGVNAVYLASQGFEVTAIDLSPTALEAGRKRALAAGVKVKWIQADVLKPPPLAPFDLIFDRGCYHGVRRPDPAGYVKTVETLCRPGGRVLILAGNANEPSPRGGPPRVDETELVADFAGGFDFERLQETRFDTATPEVEGAWAWSVLLRRKSQ